MHACVDGSAKARSDDGHHGHDGQDFPTRSRKRRVELSCSLSNWRQESKLRKPTVSMTAHSSAGFLHDTDSSLDIASDGSPRIEPLARGRRAKHASGVSTSWVMALRTTKSSNRLNALYARKTLNDIKSEEGTDQGRAASTTRPGMSIDRAIHAP